MRKVHGGNSEDDQQVILESLDVQEGSLFIHVQQCELEDDRGLWLHDEESDRWLLWGASLGYWVPTVTGPTHWFDDRPWVAENLTVQEAKRRFPGSVPVVCRVNKRVEAELKKIKREKTQANTDVQSFENPLKMPRGFSFADDATKRTFIHKSKPQSHSQGFVQFIEGPKYLAAIWHAGLYPIKGKLPSQTKFFFDKNEAQKWVIDNIRKLERDARMGKPQPEDKD
jgi:hypothetical protein